METKSKEIVTFNDASDLCRVCLAMNQNNQSIFSYKRDNADTVYLSEKIRLCGGVEVAENDGLPTTICTECVTKVNDAHKLREQCQQSDIQLRELYGKLKKECNLNPFKATKDQCCQTAYLFPSDFVEAKTNVSSTIDNNVCPKETSNFRMECIGEHEIINESKNAECAEFNSLSNKQNVSVHSKETGCEKSTASREAYRTRRMTMFKRVTSIENLKSHKERQRQYIKKNTNVKRDTIEDTGNVKDINSENSYACPKCGRCYSSKKSLDRHVLSHNEKKFACDKCNRQFFQLDKLVKHSKLHKVKEKPKPVLCRICNKSFRKTDTMVRHLNVHKRVNPKEVLSILKEIRDKRKLENAMEYEERMRKIESDDDKETTEEEFTSNGNSPTDVLEKCTIKSKRRNSNFYLSTSDGNVDEKSDSPEDGIYRCKNCSKRYSSKESLQRHLQVHVEKKFVCSVCNMKFFRQDRLRSHKDRYGHNEGTASVEIQKPSDEKSAIKLINSWIREELDSDNEEKGFPCKICGKSYDTKKSLLKHQVNVHDSREEGCANCGKTCACDEKHKDQQKVNESLKPYRCDECKKSFEKEVKLQKHLRTHERAKEQQDANFKRFLCHICSKTFRQNTGLMFHMRTHTGYKPHVCKYCGRGFTSNSNCINHERTHTGDRPFVCHFCSAAFAKSCTLKAHITTHTGEANYHCKTCGKSFRRLKYLKEHSFTHTGEKPYACKICGTAYSHSGSLFVHERKCKAQYNSYQSNATQNAETYCQSETPPSVTPIITILPQSHLNSFEF